MRKEVAMNAKLMIPMRGAGHGDEHFSSISARVSGGLVAAFDGLLDRLERRREVASLAALDDRSLKDIGLTRSDLAGRRISD
jgi:hypothetical protein